jgi:pilus assembly protein Flp/PilA
LADLCDQAARPNPAGGFSWRETRRRKFSHALTSLKPSLAYVYVAVGKVPRTAYPVANKKSTVMKLVARFLKNESGATAIEYGLIAALISVAIIGGATAVGTGVNNTFTSVKAKLG